MIVVTNTLPIPNTLFILCCRSPGDLSMLINLFALYQVLQEASRSSAFHREIDTFASAPKNPLSLRTISSWLISQPGYLELMRLCLYFGLGSNRCRFLAQLIVEMCLISFLLPVPSQLRRVFALSPRVFFEEPGSASMNVASCIFPRLTCKP